MPRRQELPTPAAAARAAGVAATAAIAATPAAAPACSDSVCLLICYQQGKPASSAVGVEGSFKEVTATLDKCDVSRLFSAMLQLINNRCGVNRLGS